MEEYTTFGGGVSASSCLAAPHHDTWEPISSFVPRINTPFMEFIRKHRVQLQVSDLEALTRAIEASGDRSPP